MEVNPRTTLYNWEELNDDRRNMEIIREARRNKITIPDKLMDIICGLQVEPEPNGDIKERFIGIEAVEDPSEKRIHETMMKLHGEEWEPEPESSENTPPDENSTRCVDSSANRKKVDRGKVMALHKAGWSLSKIADEMGCSAQRVHQIVKEENSK